MTGHIPRMAMKMASNGGFQLVRRRGRRKKRILAGNVCEDDAPLLSEIVASVLRAREDSDMLQYASQISDLLEKVECHDLVCYGIGRFGKCRIARLQLALLLHMASAKQVERILVYDPVLSPQEKAALEELGCVCIPENEACRRPVQSSTVFYMPHCGRAMYNNLMWANWTPKQLSQLALIGNSFQSYLDRNLQQKERDTFSYMFRVIDYCKEKALPPYTDPTIFNDLSLHTFSLDILLSAPSSFWMASSPPPSDPSDPEIITKQI